MLKPSRTLVNWLDWCWRTCWLVDSVFKLSLSPGLERRNSSATTWGKVDDASGRKYSKGYSANALDDSPWWNQRSSLNGCSGNFSSLQVFLIRIGHWKSCCSWNSKEPMAEYENMFCGMITSFVRFGGTLGWKYYEPSKLCLSERSIISSFGICLRRGSLFQISDLISFVVSRATAKSRHPRS